MSKKKDVNDGAVVSSGDIEHLHLWQKAIIYRHKWLRKAVLIFICLLTGLYFWHQHTLKLQVQRQAAEVAQNKLMVNVRQNVNAGDYQKAEQQVKNSPSSEEQQLMLVSVYLNKGDYRSALNTYNDIAKKYGLTRGLAENAGRTAEAAGDKQQAIYYYQQARDFIAKEKDYATKSADIANYDTKIKTLQSAQ
jgi:tetratricopeptide (TPR) repeat protein